MADNNEERIPITIFNGFLGAGKTTIILNLLNQLEATTPSDSAPAPSPPADNLPLDNSLSLENIVQKEYKVVWIKNEFGVNEVDSLLAQQSNITSVKEVTNGCLCCTLVGVLSESLYEILITNGIKCDRIIIETSGSAFPATLVQEINRVSLYAPSVDNPPEEMAMSIQRDEQVGREQRYGEEEKQDEQQQVQNLQIKQKLPVHIDGVICVVDALNYQDYSDTSFTAKIQAQYTDIILLNKHELLTQQEQDDNNNNNNTEQDKIKKLDAIKDLLYELSPDTPITQTNKGKVDYNLIFGLDTKLYEKKYLLNNPLFSSQQTQPLSQRSGLPETQQSTSHGGNDNTLQDVDVIHIEWVSDIHSLANPCAATEATTNDLTADITHHKATNNIMDIYSFEKWLSTLAIYDVIRLKGLITLLLTTTQYLYLMECYNTKTLFTATPGSRDATLISQKFPLSLQNKEQQQEKFQIFPIILNYVLGRWSYQPLPYYNPVNSFVENLEHDLTPVMINNNNNNKNTQQHIPFRLAPLYTPSSLYTPQYSLTQHMHSALFPQLRYIHNKLTLFGTKSSLSTFNFQKMCTRHLPLVIRKTCCETHAPDVKADNVEHHTHATEKGCCHNDNHDGNHRCEQHTLQHVYTTMQSMPKLGGFITVLSSDHSHAHV